MLTVIAPPSDSEPQFRHPHDFPRPLHSPPLSQPAQFPVERPDTQTSVYQTMSGHHRGLPPPAAMTLPDPTRPGPSAAPRDYSAHLPPPPSQSQVPEETMREWLIAKSEEDKRRQEELKLEQRRIEERMLRDAYQSPVTPSLIPALFAWIGGSPLASQTLELVHQQLAQSQQPQSNSVQHVIAGQASTEARQETRMGPVQYVPVPAPLAAGGQAAGGQVLPSQSQHQSAYPSPAYQSPKSRNRSIYAPPAQYGPHGAVAPSSGSLPRLTTNEPTTAAPASYTHQQDQPSPSPSIFFHHWQPPHQGSVKDGSKASPKTSQPQDQSSPPRKRKNTLQHERAPPPASNPPNMSPSFSAASTGSTKSQRNIQHRPRSRAGNYDPIRQGRRRVQAEGSSRSSQDSQSSASRLGENRSRHPSQERKQEPLS